jgi:phosphatidylglycerol lysyltransferase
MQTSAPPARGALALALDVALFALALLVLRRVLAEYRYAQILAAMGALGLRPVVASLFISLLGYATLVGYDYLSLRLVGRPLPLGRMWLPSFVGFAVANSAPLALLTSGGLRYRLFSGLGLTPGQSARVTGANVLTYVLGLFTVAGAAFVLVPLHIPAAITLPGRSLRAAGMVFLALVGALFALSAGHRHSLRLWRWRVELPPPRALFRQLLVASADWLLSSAALYVLVRATGSASYPRFLAAFLLAQIATQVVPLPGGIGVFEAIMLLLRPPGLSAPLMAAALLIYRVTYYLIPLAAAGTALVWRATPPQAPGVTPGPLEEVARFLVPHFLAVITFLAGIWLLLFGALPGNPSRLVWLGHLLPLAVIEGSHFLGSMVGTGLLLLAWGLERRIHGAWRLTLLLLILGIPTTLLRAGQVGSAGILLALAVGLVAARHAFDRRTQLSSEPLDPGWTVAAVLAIAAVAFLALFAHRHLEYAGSLWWQFAIDRDAPRALRMSVGVAGTGVLFVLGRLVAHARRRSEGRDAPPPSPGSSSPGR